MAIIPAQDELTSYGDLAVPLPTYAYAIGWDECSFNGVVRQDQPAIHTYRPTWSKSQRDLIAHYLAEAQAEIEQVCGYPLNARWFAAEEHDYSNYVLSDWTKVIEAGIEATTTISAGEAVSHAADPAVVGPFATTVTDETEIHVYHPGTDIEIHPSSITITGGNCTIEIPRCRMLTEAGQAQGDVDYTDTGALLGLYEQTVDVVQVYNDDTTQGTLIWSHGTTGCPSCSGSTATACLTVINGEIGEIDVLRATHSGGSWSTSSLSCYCHYPDTMQLNYRAGLTTITPQARDAVIRLAHAKMPNNPCNLDAPSYRWVHDREVPRALTAERLNCPFGIMNGAWIAYKWARQMKVVRGATL